MYITDMPVPIGITIPLEKEDFYLVYTPNRFPCKCTRATANVWVNNRGTPRVEITLWTDDDFEDMLIFFEKNRVVVNYTKQLPTKDNPAVKYVRNFILNNVKMRG